MLDINTITIGFIGYGNMAGAVAEGLMRSKKIMPKQIYASAKNFEKLRLKAETQGINPCKNSLEVVENCDIIFIGVKPYLLEEVLLPFQDILEGKIIISLATNKFHNDLEKIIPGSHHVCTAPNTPVSVCKGIFICEEENSLTTEERHFVNMLLETVGIVLWMDKEKIQIAGVVIGCAPAFVALFMEALADGVCKHGLSREVAYPLIAQMLAGTGQMALDSGKHPGLMKDEVCSPSGTTIIGISTLEKNGFRFGIIDAMDAMAKKVKQ